MTIAEIKADLASKFPYITSEVIDAKYNAYAEKTFFDTYNDLADRLLVITEREAIMLERIDINTITYDFIFMTYMLCLIYEEYIAREAALNINTLVKKPIDTVALKAKCIKLEAIERKLSIVKIKEEVNT